MGTNSVRVALFDQYGARIATQSAPIPTYSPRTNYYEQKTSDIWEAFKRALQQVVQDCVHQGIVSSEEAVRNSIQGITFDATCSLVIHENENLLTNDIVSFQFYSFQPMM